ncbi:MAG: hypothetical protein ACK50Y_06765 [Flavobacteriia bacterium]
MIRRYFHIVFVLGILFSCNKNKVEDPILQGAPIFNVNATLDGEELSVAAGENGFVLSTSTEWKNGVRLFSGKLANNDLEIGMALFDGHLDVPNLTLNSLAGHDLLFHSNEQEELLDLSLEMFPNAEQIDEIKWYVDGVLSGINELQINEPGKYTICAAVTFDCGSQATLCNEMILGYSKSAVAQVRHFIDSDGHVQAWVDASSGSIDHIQWKLDGQNVSVSNTLNCTVSPQFHTVTAVVYFQNGAVREKSALIDGQIEGNFLDDFSIFECMPSLFYGDYSVILTMKRNGLNYSSEYADNQMSSVLVKSINYFGKNASGKPVFKISAQIDCLLGQLGTSEVVPFQGEMNFGIEVDK